MIKKNIIAGILALGLIGVSCSSDDAPVPVANLTMEVIGLEALTNGATYEGWLIVDGTPMSTGKFTNTATSQIFIVNADQLNKASEFVLSIEPPNDNDAGPSNTKLLSGTFSGNTASVTINSVVGNFSTASGKYVMATPTDDPATTDNDEFGIWFEDPNDGTAIAGLDLPQLSSGWKYEGWVIFKNETPVTTGKFTDVNSFDESSPYSGNAPAPNFPGEDFLSNPPAGKGLMFPVDGDVRGKTVVISVEPAEDFDVDNPFFLKPLSGRSTQLTAPAINTLQWNDDAPFGRVLR